MVDLTAQIPRMGAKGPAGTSIHSSDVAPQPEDGNVGDVWLRVTSSLAIAYGPKTEAGWPAGVSFKGQQGVPGPSGPIGGHPFIYSTATADEDPGNGYMRISDNDFSQAGWLYFSKLTATGGDVGNWLVAMAAPNNPIKGDLFVITFENSLIASVASFAVLATDDQGDRVRIQVDPAAQAGTALLADGTRVVTFFVARGDNAFASVELTDNVGPLGGFRNALINGDFTVAQRGTNFASPSSYSHLLDRWQLNFDGSGATRTISQLTRAPGDEAPGGTRNGLRWVQSVAGSGGTYNLLQQNIEGVHTLAGKDVRISFYAWVDAGTESVTIRLTQSFGTGGSSNVETVSDPLTITTTPTRFEIPLTLPSVAGKTFGTGHRLIARFELPVNAAFAFNVMEAQLEEGTVVTPFERVDPTTQFMRCARYYQRVPINSEIFAAGLATSSTQTRFPVHLPVAMRAAPTVTQAGAIKVVDATGASYTASLVGSAISDDNRICSVRVDAAVGFGPVNGVRFLFSSSAGALIFDAEF
ncbi:hypothetical protein [Microbaculum marinisediminis]|uniref:Uncharacterized protein n=1 Tax=Microbaculum marinisediminis TaxID=2931392 RepID=A0AAW5QUE4_9HYPH|nr:hypothetical protein [Microbaculum sp. A6E488]MCT8970572.1 hypothetical protein [Microbaculum sp. A6E488]